MTWRLLFIASATAIISGCSSNVNGPTSAVPIASNEMRRVGPSWSKFEFYAGPSGYYQHQMAAGPLSSVWFRDERAGKIGFISALGAVTEYSLPSGHTIAAGIAAGPDGAIWYTENSGYVDRLTTMGNVTVYPLPRGVKPFDIVAGSDGNLWFTALQLGDVTSSNRAWAIGKFSTTGVTTLYRVPGYNAWLNDIALGPDGNIWYANGGSRTIGRVSTDGAIVEFAVPGGLSPLGITRAADGSLYSAARGTGAALLKITPSGNVTEIVDPANPNQFSYITEGPQRCVWGGRTCASGSGECLALYNVTHRSFHEYQFPSSVKNITGLIAGPDGNMWFQVYSRQHIVDGLGSLTYY